ncbi:hypothetical protein BDQ17DRAFT_1257658, partial [Cyathus striatus]
MDSLFEQHLGTNYVPSFEEERQIRDCLEITSKGVHDIDVKISQLQRQQELLHVKRQKIFDLAEQYRALISPARRLGRDILQEIFVACLPTDRNPYMSASEAPMLLTQICSSWRRIAHSTPRLWAAIHIVLPSVNIREIRSDSFTADRKALVRHKINQRKSGTKQWLRRSGACPLSISIYQSTHQYRNPFH